MNTLSNMIQEKNTREKLKRFLKFFLGAPLTLISFFFIVRFIYSGKDEILSQISSFNVLPFLLGIFFLLLFFLFRSIVWKYLLKNEGHDIGLLESTYLLANAEIKRYIPGSILSFASRVNNFNSFRIPARTTVKLILYESALFVITSALISIPAAFYFFSGVNVVFIILTAILVIVATTIFLKKRTHLELFSAKGGPANGWEAPFILMIFAWAFYGLGSYLVSSSFIYIDPSKIIQVSSYFVISWLAGYLVLIVPMGLGVRESVTTFGLSQLMPVSFAASISLITRIILVVSEVLFLGLSYFFHKYVHIKRQISHQALILWVSIASYISYFTYYSFEKHANFFTGRFDLGNMDQTVWNTLNGRIFQLTNPDGTDTISRLAIHADFLLILLAPLYLIWEDPRMLLLIQTVVIGLGAYFVYKIARLILKNANLSLVFAISYLLNPFIQKQNLFDFHAVVFSTTFLLAAFYFTLSKNYKFFFSFLIFAVLAKENVFLPAAIFGLYLTFSTKNKKWLFLTLASLFIFYVLVSKLIPWARGGQHFAAEYFGEFGDTPPEILSSLILNPLNTISSFLTQSNFTYLYKLFLPVGFLSIFSPFVLFFAAPDLAINMLSENENLRNLTFHYGATIIPFIYIASILGLKRILDFRLKFITPKLASYFIIAFSILSAWQYGVLPGSKNPSLEVYNNTTAERHKIKRLLEMIPRDLSVASSNNLGAHLSQRKALYTIPQGLYKADVVVLLLNDKYASPSLSTQIEYARDLSYNPEYIELARFGDFIAFAKRNTAGKIRTRD